MKLEHSTIQPGIHYNVGKYCTYLFEISHQGNPAHEIFQLIIIIGGKIYFFGIFGLKLYELFSLP